MTVCLLVNFHREKLADKAAGFGLVNTNKFELQRWT
jgi:hypothetical protein